METEIKVTKQHTALLTITQQDLTTLRGICDAWEDHQRLLPEPNVIEAAMVQRIRSISIPATDFYSYDDELRD